MRKILAALLLLVGLSVTVTPAVYAATTGEEELCRGAGMTWKDGTCVNNNGGPTVQQTVENVVNVLLFLIGAIAVIMIVIGGLRYVLSNGEQAQLTSAKNTIIYACVGLVVSVMAYAIVNFVLRYFA